MALIPIPLIFLASLLGIFLWEGLEYNVLWVPTSLHDLIYVLILTLSIDIDERRRTYHSSASWMVALLFIVQASMQVFDVRPPGTGGSYQLLADNIANAVFFSLFLFVLWFRIKMGVIRSEPRFKFLTGLSVLFLAFNALLVYGPVRALSSDYVMLYDTVFCIVIYAICLSANNRVNEFIRACFYHFHTLLCYRGLGARKG